MYVLGALGVLYAAALVFALTGYRLLLYPAPGAVREPVLAAAKLHRIAAPDGSTVYALHVPAPEGAPTIVHFHGNGEQLADGTWLASRLRAAGVGVYLVEYPGYGLARGVRTTEAAIYAAAEAALDHLERSIGVPNERIILQGQSLGTGVATEMAARGHGARLILVSPYTSIVDMASHYAPILPARLYVGDRFETAAKAPGVSIPVLIVHGTLDEVIPVRMGRELAKIFPSASLEIVDGGHHNDLFADPAAPLVARLARFARLGT